jgi:UDP-N-acetylglucosamine diphosphorylase/glucosamine-1-phosphate N-acetyltransferase
MNINLFDQPRTRTNLLPFTFTRPVSEIRIGILTISDKWAKFTGQQVYFLTENYLQNKYSSKTEGLNIYIDGSVCPTEQLAEGILNLKEGQIIMNGDTPISWIGTAENTKMILLGNYPDSWNHIRIDGEVRLIQNLWDIFVYNREQVIADFQLLTRGRTSEDIKDDYTKIYGEKNLFVEPGAEIRAATINAERGPVYIGKNAQILEGAIIRGATSVGEGSILNIAGRVVGDSCIGPFCKVGGEISNSVIFGYSSKGHDGFLGNSVLGEWCNLGADTNTSNLKNNYKSVKLWNYTEQAYINTGRQFCGLMLGDHSKCGINTMFNTGTVAGVGANIFGAGFQSNFIPSFSWGGVQGFTTYHLEKFFDLVPRVYERRNKEFDKIEEEILTQIFDDTKKYRNW